MLGRFGEAAADCRSCLTLYDPEQDKDLFIYSLINLSNVLFKGGLACPTGEYGGGTLGQVLESAFAEQPQVRAYVLDDQGVVRKHIMVFVNGEQLADRADLSVAVAPGDQIFVMQALSGG